MLRTYPQIFHTTITTTSTSLIQVICCHTPLVEIRILRLHNVGILLQHSCSGTNHHSLRVGCITRPPWPRWVHDDRDRWIISRTCHGISKFRLRFSLNGWECRFMRLAPFALGGKFGMLCYSRLDTDTDEEHILSNSQKI